MRINLEHKTDEDIAQLLVSDSIDINELNLARQNQRAGFLLAIAKRPNILSKVAPQNANHFFSFAIKDNPENFVYLKREQYTDELAQLYLSMRLENANDDLPERGYRLLVQKSLDDKLLFNYSFVTADGDELYYLDSELNVPVSLRSSVKMVLKLTDAIKLIDKLDVHITELGDNKIKSTIIDLVALKYKTYLSEFVKDKKMGYYTLSSSLDEITEYIKDKLVSDFEAYGIAVSDLIIKKIAIPKDIQNKIEDQAFQIRQRRADMDADDEFAKRSLENYEAKLSVQEKYPNAEESLTEYEKDLALKRYLVKNGLLSEDEIDHSIKLTQKVDKADTVISKKDDIIPDIPAKPNKFRKGFITALVLFLLTSVIFLFTNTGVGLIILGATVALFGSIAAFKYENLLNTKIEADQGDYINE